MIGVNDGLVLRAPMLWYTLPRMSFDDIEKRMAKHRPRSRGFVLAVAGLVLIGLNFVINEVSRENADFGGRHWTTYWPAGIGIACVLCGLIAKRYPSVAFRMVLAVAGLVLIGLNMLLDEWLRISAENAGQSIYWVSHLPAGFGCVLLIASVTTLGSRSTTGA